MSMRRIAYSILLVLFVAFQAISSQALAQEIQASRQADRVQSSVSADLLALYKRTKVSQDESGVTNIARQCAKIVPDQTRSKVDRDYASSLFAWALNRRGELRNERAAKAVELGNISEAKQLDQKATEDFETALKYGPTNWRIHHNYAISLAMNGDYTDAIKQFSDSINLKPDYANSHFNRGELYFELGRYEQAVGDYSRAIAIDASDPQYFNSRGHCQFMLESYDAAIEDYQEAARIGSDSAVYQTDLADAQQFVGRWEQAALAYRKAIAINNKFQRAYQNASWLMATCPVEKYRNPELALSAAKKAMELGGQRTARAVETLAAATAARGKFQEAAKLQSQAISLAPAEDKPELTQRLRIYKGGLAYHQPVAAATETSDSGSGNSRIQTASAASNSLR